MIGCHNDILYSRKPFWFCLLLLDIKMSINSIFINIFTYHANGVSRVYIKQLKPDFKCVHINLYTVYAWSIKVHYHQPLMPSISFMWTKIRTLPHANYAKHLEIKKNQLLQYSDQFKTFINSSIRQMKSLLYGNKVKSVLWTFAFLFISA